MKRNMFLEIDQIMVPQELLDYARSGDNFAKRELAKLCDGLILYQHVFHGDGAVVSLMELCKLGVITSVVVHA